MECRALIDLNPQDIIELPMRRGKEKADNYTCKTAVKKGASLTIPVFADTPAAKGMVLSRIRNEVLIQKLHELYVDRKIKGKDEKPMLSAFPEIQKEQEKGLDTSD